MRTKLLVSAGLAAAFLLTLNAAQAQDYPVQLPAQVIQQSFALGRTPFVKVSNINGTIEVVGDGGSTVRVTATERIQAQTEDLAVEAQREVRLAFDHTGDSLDVYINGPFRNHHWENPGYQVSFAFALHVPRGSAVALRTVNGSVQLENVSGRFRATTVNGSVDVTGAAGAGTVRTVNGHVRAAFRAQPDGDCAFHTVNGSIHVTFPRGLNAVLRYKTFHGSVYTDFNVNPLPGMAPASARHDGERVFRIGRFTLGQIGHGGPRITLDTLNGSIYIHRASSM